MARGIFTYRASLAANADTAVVTPAADETVYVYWITAMVSVAGTTSRVRVENGVGGGKIFRMATVTADTSLQQFYDGGNNNWRGDALSPGAVLNINTSGGAAATVDMEICYEVR